MGWLTHIFSPHESNNYRAKLLHHKILVGAICLLFFSAYFLNSIKINFPSVLGISTEMTPQELVILTNQKRAELGLSPLTLNQRLSEAATGKAKDMFTQNYWAHNSPDGKTPWVFIKTAGYNYVFAGENLARGYTTAADVVSAWMASPDHKKNMLSPNYNDVGFSVDVGKLSGEDTVLVVEMLASGSSGNVAQAITDTQKTEENAQNQTNTPQAKVNQANGQKTIVAAAKTKPLLDSGAVSRNIALFVILLFIFVLCLDIIIIKRKRVVRFVGHNIDHIVFLIFILILIFILTAGTIA